MKKIIAAINATLDGVCDHTVGSATASSSRDKILTDWSRPVRFVHNI
ncbi:MAG TPA: hypothetical protein VKZ57_00890 [Sphingobacterium sp.]|jgi:hypothetical protein|nr:hypothetical protein [Sphingobacterium sp.]